MAPHAKFLTGSARGNIPSDGCRSFHSFGRSPPWDRERVHLKRAVSRDLLGNNNVDENHMNHVPSDFRKRRNNIGDPSNLPFISNSRAYS